MEGFFDPRFAMLFLGSGFALSIFASAASNLSFSTFIFSPCYYGGCGGIQTPETCCEHVYTEYRSGALNHSATHPQVKFVGAGTVASRNQGVVSRTTMHAEALAKDNQRASSFLNSTTRVSSLDAPRALRILNIESTSHFLSGKPHLNPCSKTSFLNSGVSVYSFALPSSECRVSIPKIASSGMPTLPEFLEIPARMPPISRLSVLPTALSSSLSDTVDFSSRSAFSSFF